LPRRVSVGEVTLVQLAANGTLQEDVLSSLARVLTGFLIGALLGAIWIVSEKVLPHVRDHLESTMQPESFRRLDRCFWSPASSILSVLNPAIARFVLERDRHTCQRCGTTHQVGIDFRGATPSGEQEITTDDLEASCSQCFLGQWKTLQGTPGTDAERTGIRSKLW
jgi:5-methylcytosine-specific restriction endonuclease McrA